MTTKIDSSLICTNYSRNLLTKEQIENTNRFNSFTVQHTSYNHHSSIGNSNDKKQQSKKILIGYQVSLNNLLKVVNSIIISNFTFRQFKSSEAVLIGGDIVSSYKVPKKKQIITSVGKLSILDKANNNVSFISFSDMKGKYAYLSLTSDGKLGYQGRHTHNVSNLDSLVDNFTVSTTDRTIQKIYVVGKLSDYSPTINDGYTSSVICCNKKLETTNQLLIDDKTKQSKAFLEQSINGKYGSVSIIQNGTWTYKLENEKRNSQTFGSNANITDVITVYTSYGSPQNITINLLKSTPSIQTTQQASNKDGNTLIDIIEEQLSQELTYDNNPYFINSNTISTENNSSAVVGAIASLVSVVILVNLVGVGYEFYKNVNELSGTQRLKAALKQHKTNLYNLFTCNRWCC